MFDQMPLESTGREKQYHQERLQEAQDDLKVALESPWPAWVKHFYDRIMNGAD